MDLGQGEKTGILTLKTDEKELKVKVEVTPETKIETHGKHLLDRGMKNLEWLVETGVTVLIDPQLFESTASIRFLLWSSPTPKLAMRE